MLISEEKKLAENKKTNNKFFHFSLNYVFPTNSEDFKSFLNRNYF